MYACMMRQACQTNIENDEVCNEQASLYQHEVQKIEGSRSITTVCHPGVYAVLHHAMQCYTMQC